MEETQIDFNEARLKARIALKEQTDAQARRSALLEEVVEIIESHLAYDVEYLSDVPKRISESRDKHTNLIARVRAEWGEG